jgi:hypothetical protein
MPPLGVMAPETFQDTPLEEYGRPYSRPVMNGEALDMKHHPCIDHEIRLSLSGTKKASRIPREEIRTPCERTAGIKIGEADAKIKCALR